MAGGEGVLRDSEGDWLGGFSFHQNACMAEEAELREPVVGLRTAWTMGFQHLVAETDSQQVLDWILRGEIRNLFSNLVERYREMLKWRWKVELKLIFREANQAANCLAEMGVSGLRVDELENSIRAPIRNFAGR